MPHASIDVRRGVMVKKHRTGGFYVYMYLDTPGVYFFGNGNSMPSQIAAEAGFDIPKFEKQRIKKERMREAMTAIEMELELVSEMDDERVIASSGEFRVVAVGAGRAHVYDGPESRVTPVPIPEKEAKTLMETLAGDNKDKSEKVHGSKAQT